jgi:hypothetical protein
MMHLSTEQVGRFYNIWFPLLHYVNEQRGVVESFPAEWGAASVDSETAAPIRDVLWEDDTLREMFIAENPAELSAGDLALVESWKHRVTGSFFIFRHLKKYTIFLSGESPVRAYAVLGIAGSIEEIIGPNLPLYVKTALLPFEDCIIYDSLLLAYSVYFGGGIRRDLVDAYRSIQEREGVIMTLPPDVATPDTIRAGNAKLLSAFRKHLGKAGLSPRKMQEHMDNVAAFADDFLLTQELPCFLLDVTGQDLETYLSQTQQANLVSFKRFLWFLRDTGRMDWGQAEDMLDDVKRRQRR